MLKKVFAPLAVAAVFGISAPAWAVCQADKPTLTPTDQYAIIGDTVLDKKSGLTWARCSIGQQWQEEKGCTGRITQFKWPDAMALAKDGWRVPTRDELQTLLSPTCLAPSINTEAFPGMQLRNNGYWSSTPQFPFLGWVVFFDSGFTSKANTHSSYAVRLVRSG